MTRVARDGACLLAASHIDESAGGEGCVIREQPEDRMRHLLCCSAAFHGHEVLDAVYPIRFAAACVHLGIDEARPNGVHADTFFRDFPGETDCQRVNGPL